MEGETSSTRSKKLESGVYKMTHDSNSDEMEPSMLDETEKRKPARKDRVYLHVQNQLADKAASRAARKDKKEDVQNLELFVDRQRQAAVVLGERDLAGDVKAKRKRERAKGQAEALDAFEYLTYLSQGIFEMKCGSAERALGYLNKAVELESDDETPLVVRSQCFNRLNRPQDAIEDATKALKINPHSSKAVISRGEALYSMGQFEQGLVQFERGWRSRRDPKMKIGLMQCKDAITNAVGPNSKGFDLELVAKVIKDMEKSANNINKAKTDCHQHRKSRAQIRREKKKREAKRMKMDKVLLGEVAKDVSFLRGLVGDDMDTPPRAVTPAEKKIVQIATETLDYLEKRKTFWQQTAMCSV